GLMQLMPATAAGLASKLQLPYSVDRLTADSVYNLTLGRSYIETMIDEFGGSYPLAIAAYNAGPGRVRQWLREFGDPRGRDISMVDWIEMIPFSETRLYVHRVLENLQIYRGQDTNNVAAFSLASDLARRGTRYFPGGDAARDAVHKQPSSALTGSSVSDLNYTVELVPPDIEPYRAGNTGIDYVTTFEAAEPGPHVVVTALTHGNEICGAIALDRLFRAEVRPRQGRLTLAFNNVAAYSEFDPRYPIASRYVDEDFNRLWNPATLDGPRQSMELARARMMRPIIDSAALLLDLHSMQYATAPLLLARLLRRSPDSALPVGIR